MSYDDDATFNLSPPELPSMSFALNYAHAFEPIDAPLSPLTVLARTDATPSANAISGSLAVSAISLSSRKQRTHSAWRHESVIRRSNHALTDAKRRSHIGALHRRLVQCVANKLANGEAFTTADALQRAIHIVEHSVDPPRPLVPASADLSALHRLMSFAVEHYSSGASFHHSMSTHRMTEPLTALLAAGGYVSVLSTDMRILDSSHDVCSDFEYGKTAMTQCRLRLSDGSQQHDMTYAQLQQVLLPLVDSLDATKLSPSERIQSAPSILFGAVCPRFGRSSRSIKLGGIVRRFSQGQPGQPVMLTVEYLGAMQWIEA